MNPSAPYLPPAEKAPGNKRSTGKTIFLYLLAIVILIAVYQRFAGTPPRQESLPEGSRGPLFVLLPALLVGGLFIWYLRRQFRSGPLLNARLEPGHLALADGDLGRAVDVFAAVARDCRQHPGYAALANLSLATALMRQGELQKALDATIEVERASGLAFGSDLRARAAAQLGLLYALRGQLDVATRWCDDARRRLGRSCNRTYNGALVRITEIMVLARTGRREEAARAFDRDAQRLAEALSASTLRTAWLVRAFVASADGARASLEPWLTLARSGRKGDVAWIRAEWPELRAFVDAHDL